MSKRESTLKEVEISTKQLRELLDQQTISGTSLLSSDDVKVCGMLCRQSPSSTGPTTQTDGFKDLCESPVTLVL